MKTLETDYLVVGAGACALAFADTLLEDAPGVHLTLVDRHGAPGGHWNAHRPTFDIAPGVRLEPPGALPHLWRERAPRPSLGSLRAFVVLGAGKTAMDTVVWLQQCGAAPASIAWVRPRDSWLIDRGTTQPGPQFFHDSIGAQADTMEALAQADSASELFERLEQRGCMLRIDRAHAPTMFHFATVSRREVEMLRRVERVIRRGRVRALHGDRMELDGGSEPVAPATLFIDCTASAVTRRPAVPVFQPGRITLQMVRIPQPTFSASLVAHLEALHDDDAQKNRMCAPIPLPDTLDEYPRALLVHMRNQHLWNQDAGLRQWIRGSRLDAWGRMIDEIDPEDSAKQALLGRMRAASKAAAAAAPRWAVVNDQLAA